MEHRRGRHELPPEPGAKLNFPTFENYFNNLIFASQVHRSVLTTAAAVEEGAACYTDQYGKKAFKSEKIYI